MGSIDRTKSGRKSSLGCTVPNAETPNINSPERATGLPSSSSGTSIASSRTIGPQTNRNIIKRAVQHTAERLSPSRSSKSNSGSSRLTSALRKSNNLTPCKGSGSESSDIEDPVLPLSPPCAPALGHERCHLRTNFSANIQRHQLWPSQHLDSLPALAQRQSHHIPSSKLSLNRTQHSPGHQSNTRCVCAFLPPLHT